MDRLVSSDDRASDPDRRPAVHAIHVLCDPALAAVRLAVVAVGRRRHEDTLSANPSGPPRCGGGSGGGSMFSGKEQPSGGKIHA
jgi:hypothetical protein